MNFTLNYQLVRKRQGHGTSANKNVGIKKGINNFLDHFQRRKIRAY
jgi:hypothetical protein